MDQRRLRIGEFVVRMTLVWDDGEELSPGPPTDPVVLPNLSALRGFSESVTAKVADLQHRLESLTEPVDDAI